MRGAIKLAIYVYAGFIVHLPQKSTITQQKYYETVESTFNQILTLTYL